MYNEAEYFTYTNQQKLKIKEMDFQQTEKANLDGTRVEPTIDKDSLYLIDFSKCESVNDLMTILSVIGFQFSPTHPGFQYIKKFLALDKPIPARPQQMLQPEQKDMKLPKLKKLK
jgi:hypothetical protein